MSQQQIKLDKNVTIELTPQYLQIVLGYLAGGAFKDVSPVINSIEQQVIEQLKLKDNEQESE